MSSDKDLWTIDDNDFFVDGYYIDTERHEFTQPQSLDDLHIQYKQGDKFALMQAINRCARGRLVMPTWVAVAYGEAFDAIATHKSKNWNEVLGDPLPKGANLAALRRKQTLQWRVYNEVVDLIHRNPSRAIDASLFEEAGEKFGIKKTLAEKYCRNAEKTDSINLADIKSFYLKRL